MKIAIYGSASGDIKDDSIQKAKLIGKLLAEKGNTIVTGASTGLPFEAVKKAKENNGKCIGFAPAISLVEQKEKNLPYEEFDEIFFVPKEYEYANEHMVLTKYRNVSTAAFVDAAIIIGGRIGTMNEFTNMYDIGKPIGVLTGTGGIADKVIKDTIKAANKPGPKVIFESEPEKLIDQLLSLLSST
tara:strand:- start:12400 stop:12957 length:558 start_codon:yes stop_codon:yes gene_type:complete